MFNSLAADRTAPSEGMRIMGADIHLVVECANAEDFLRPRGIALLDWPRQTELFVAISGLWEGPALIPARGFPNPASYLANREYGVQVVKSDDVEAMLAFPSILEDEAQEAIDNGQSQFLPHLKGFISNPAWSSASWLTRKEFLKCVEHSGIEQLSLEVDATLTMMEFIENAGYYARMVFWFDV
jgi:hypothetical protein